MAERRQERVLGGVVGVVLVADDAPDDRVDECAVVRGEGHGAVAVIRIVHNVHCRSQFVQRKDDLNVLSFDLGIAHLPGLSRGA